MFLVVASIVLLIFVELCTLISFTSNFITWFNMDGVEWDVGTVTRMTFAWAFEEIVPIVLMALQIRKAIGAAPST